MVDSLNSTIEELKAIQEPDADFILHINNLVSNHNNDIRNILTYVMNPSMDMDTLEKIIKRRFWHCEEILSELDADDADDTVIDETLENIFGDDLKWQARKKFDDAYAEYKRQVNIVNNHNDDMEEVADGVRDSPMSHSVREKLLNLIDERRWELPYEPNESDYI